MSMSQEKLYISGHCMKIGENILAGPFPFIYRIPFFLCSLIYRERVGK